MKTDNGVTLVEPGDSLPQLQGAKELYCDFETRSNSYFEPGFYPYHGSSIAGIAITADDIDESWYVPIRHRYKEGTRNPNLDVESTIQWLKNVIESCESWVNHNIKFDAHFALVEGIEPKCRLVDTLTLAKIIESDRLGYDLSVLSFEWLDENIEKYEFRIKNYLANLNLGQGNRKVKDYSLIPVDYMAPYAGQDVLTNRRLWKYIQSKCPEQCERVLETEIKLTSALLDIERIGLNVNLQQLELTKLKLLNSLIKKEDKLAELTGVEFSPHTNGGCFKVLCSKYGLPILGWTDNENPSPSFDKHTLLQYSKHPKVSADPKLSKIVSLILKYRKQHTLLTLFVEKYIELQTDGVLRPSYNQCVRTGRMSCKNPNGQQLNKEAKSLILPGKGRAFLSIDYNQVEFRLIAHYIQDSAVIEAYKQNPYQDFHTWVAEMCDTTRGPAKNINFAIAFGGGKKRVVEMLSNNAELMAGFGEKIERIKREKNLTEDQVVSLYEGEVLRFMRLIIKLCRALNTTLKKPRLKLRRWVMYETDLGAEDIYLKKLRFVLLMQSFKALRRTY